MRTLVLTTLTGVSLADHILRVDEQQFHHQYTRVAMLMFASLIAGCGLLSLCGLIAYALWR